MKELVIISGKGGTGKTSLLAAFASLAEKKVLCDADVDAADLHLIMKPRIRKRHDFQSGHTACINRDKCIQCGLCRDLCKFEAISEHFEVDPVSCEGCGVCVYFCPEKAIDFPVKTCGEWYISDTRFGPMVHARLGIAEENSGKLVSLVRREARKIAEEKNLGLILTDGPPGVGCPVIASIGGASAVLIVTEPTVSGKHDMQRVIQLADFFNIPALVCINKFDLNTEMSREIEDFAEEKKLTCVGHIPFDPVFIQSMVKEKTVIEYEPDGEAGQALKKIWDGLVKKLGL